MYYITSNGFKKRNIKYTYPKNLSLSKLRIHIANEYSNWQPKKLWLVYLKVLAKKKQKKINGKEKTTFIRKFLNRWGRDRPSTLS